MRRCGLLTHASRAARSGSAAELYPFAVGTIPLQPLHDRVEELPAPELDRFIHIGEDHLATVIATMVVDGFGTIVGEARYAEGDFSVTGT